MLLKIMRKKNQVQQPVYSPTSQTGFSEGQDNFSAVQAKLVSKSISPKLGSKNANKTVETKHFSFQNSDHS